MEIKLSEVKELLGDRFKEDELLSKHTTFRIGGPAKYFALTQSFQELEKALSWAEQNKISHVIIGGGSNILASDGGYPGLVINNSSSRIVINGETIECDAGVILTKVLNESLVGGLVGLEWATGIPGTIGGAIRGNAGAYGSDMGKNIIEVRVLRGNQVVTIPAQDCKFGYRESIFKGQDNKDVILSAKISLSRGNIDEARERVKKILTERAPKFVGFSAGCIFKNVEMSSEEMKEFKDKFPDFPDQYVKYRKVPAAWVIDKCGLKGKEIGRAQVSEKHAGIIINNGGATAENVIMLVSIIKQKVRDSFGIQLMEEIEYLGF